MIQQTRLDNGLTILTEDMPHVRSVAVGIWVRRGSRDETEAESGISHFIEHLLFKGTKNRNTREIAQITDALGGHMDAFTSREFAGYYTKIVDDHLPLAFDVLADLVTQPLFDETELEKERGVIIEEIKMVEDQPDELVFELFSESFWPHHPLGRQIAGTIASVSNLSREKVIDYFQRIYTPQNLVITAAGNLTHDGIVELSSKYFTGSKNSNGAMERIAPPTSADILLRHKKQLEQSHIVLGVPCPSLVDDDRFVVNVLSTVLGGGMSSRLFQTIREDRGLAYTVSAGINAYVDAGCLSIYAGTSPEQVSDVVNLSIQELRKMKEEKVSEEELQRSKDLVKTSIVLGLESTRQRMSRLAQQEIFFGEISSVDEIVQEIQAVTADDVHRLANDLFQSDKVALTILGKVKNLKIDRSRLEC
ncbi:MAG TPA: pitrilysin family protein [Blastocatellia bacterium]|nr:pitrilysin family protein [Blastocatellia bacterium]